MDALLRLLMGPWTTYILWVLHSNGPTRFGELKRRVSGISAKMLTERLRMLEESGVVDRNHQPTVPPQVTYSLTARGQELRQVLDGLSELARRWQLADTETAAAPAEAPAPAGVERPEAQRPEAPRPEAQRPEAQRPEAQRPEAPRAEPRHEAAPRPMVPAAE